jgi:spore coat polysaccharide biosynthesis protein SpsF
MKTVAIVQARMGSTRLPGKVMADIGGKPMLERVVERVRSARLIDEIWVATTIQDADDAIVQWCDQARIACARGSEDDVLGRYADTALQSGAEIIVRITSDCPMIDPVLIDEVVKARAAVKAMYCSNTMGRSYPDGLDVEAFTAAALQRANTEASKPSDRAHVTAYMYARPWEFSLFAVAGPARGEVRWTVDTAADLELVRAMYAELGEDFTWREALALYDARPDLAAINAGVAPKAVSEG